MSTEPITAEPPKPPQSFVEIFQGEEAAGEWSQAIQATEAKKRGESFTPKPRVDADEADENALVAELEKTTSAPEVKPEVKVDATPEPTFKTAKASEHFKKLKEESQKRVDALTKELAEARAADANTAELESIKAERDQERQLRSEFEEKLKLVAVREHPGFKKHFDAKIDSAMAMAKQIAGPTYAAKIEQVLKMPEGEYRNSQLDEIVDSLGSTQKIKLGAALVEFERINSERDGEIAKYQQRYQEMTASQKKQQEESMQQFHSVFDGQLKQMTDPTKGFDIFRSKEGDDAWNTEVTERLAIAKSVYTGELEPKERANMAFWAAAAPKFMRDNAGLRKELAEARKQLEGLKANKPKLGEDAGITQEGEVAQKFDSFTSPEAQAAIAQKMGRA